MDQGLEQLQWSRRKVALLEREQARWAAYSQPDYQWNFKAAVSCPPSTVIHVRGGRTWYDPIIGGFSFYVDSESYNIADESETGYSYTFSDAYYYKPLAVLLRWHGMVAPGIPPIRIIALAEQATAAEAESIAYPSWPGGAFSPDAYYGHPLGIFIMRNNGNITEANQFMPVDRVNRGRSYLWRELKVRFQW